MNIWNQYTLFRLLVFFAAGILLATSFENALKIPIWLFIVLGCFLIIFQLLSAKKHLYRWRWITGLVLGLIMFCFGIEWSRLHDHKNHPGHFMHHYSEKQPALIRIKSPVEARPNSFKALGEVLALESDSVWRKVKGNILLYFPKDSLSEKIAYGDMLLIFSKLNQPSPPKNPGEFDYKRFLANKNIYHQTFVRQDEWIRTGRDKINPVVNYALELRNTFMHVFENHGINDRDFAVATALILGMSDYLDNDTRKQFSTAGAMHVLCVSGLHVGIIMLVLNSMLFFLNRNKYTRLLRSILLLLGIWFYALLTGLAPSVLRASAMFSFVIIGMNMNRRADIYNSLTASAFFLLLYNPFLIREVGFQLSYTAVIAIVSMQPRLYQLWRPRFWLPDKIWAIVTVSVAAQLGTAPLGLYYFHQFPNYFIVTNLLVIPLATLILYSGFLTVILSPIPLLGGWISEILVYLLKTMNFSVAFIDGLPYSATTGVFISMLEMFILFLIIMAGFRALTLRRVFLLKTALFLLLLYLGVGLYNGLQHMSRQRLVVYALQNDMAIDFINGRNSIMLIDSARLADPSSLEFQVAGHHVRCGIKQQKLLAFNELVRNNKHDAAKAALKIHYPFAFFNGQVILFLDHNFSVLSAVEDRLKVDLLILNHSHRNPADIFDNLDASCVVIGNNIPPWIALNWAETCAELDVPCHVVRKDGAFVMDL